METLPFRPLPAVFALTCGALLAWGTDAWAQECSHNCRPEQRDAHGCCPAVATNAAPATTTSAAQHASPCTSAQHASAGHCCAAGEEWVEARGQCICLDASACGAEHPASSGAPEHAPAALSYSLRAETRATPARGGDEGTPFTLHCAAGQVAAGLIVRSTNDIEAVSLQCAALNPDGTLEDGHPTRAAGGPGGTSAQDMCPSGQVAMALSGRSDLRVVRLAFQCAPLSGGSVAGTDVQTLPGHGGTDGDPFLDACPPGHAITGLDGRAGPDGLIAIRAACTRVAPANGPNFVAVAAQHRSLPARGVPTSGTHYALQCAAGEIATGVYGRHTSLMTNVSLHCSRLYPDGSLSDPHGRGDAGGASGAEFDDTCPNGEVLVGLNGRVGRAVDHLGVQCAVLSRWMTSGAEPRASTGHGGNGGDPFVDNCAPGYVIDGVSGSAGNLVDAVQAQCVRVQR